MLEVLQAKDGKRVVYGPSIKLLTDLNIERGVGFIFIFSNKMRKTRSYEV